MADGAAPVETSFLYDAFISYRHVDRDRKWAEWLIAALEGYRVPKALRGRGLPPRLRKIFRDEDELPSSADLNDQIKAALLASRFLIVVCSAFTPRSKWVEREIQLFNELGRGDQVLALLTEGEPADSFPDAMLVRCREVVDADGSKRIVKEDKEPLAADVRPRPGVSSETSKRLALLRLVAVILGVKFDDLRQREHEREHKRHRTWAAIAAALMLLIAGTGGLYWNMVRPTTTYYRQLVWRRGVPDGAAPIDTATHDRLPRSYSVIRQGGKVVEVRHDGWTRTEPDGFARWVVHYGDDGTAQKIEIFGVGGRLIRENVLTREPSRNKMIVSFERNGNSVGQDATQSLVADTGNANPAPAQNKSGITRHELTFDDDGFATEVRYQDNWGTPQHDAQGSFGERFSYSPEGFVLRKVEIGPAGEEITLKTGVHAVVSAYDAQGNLARVTLLAEDGRPITGPDGYAYYTREYDSWGVGTSQEYYGPEGRLALSSSGDAKFVVKHDAHGDVTEVAYYDADDKLAPMKDGYALTKRKYDDHQNLIEQAFFDANGQPTFNTLGEAGIHQAYDQRGNIVEADYFGIDGAPTISKQSFAKLTKVFDSHGNLVKESYYGVDGQPTLSTSRYATYRAQFDERDQRTEVDYLGVDGKPTLSKEAIATIKYRYDGRGNEIERTFFGVDGKPTLLVGGADGSSGYASIHQTFDERGNLIETAYFGVDNEPALYSSLAAAAIRYAYDARGNVIEMKVFGVDGKPTVANGGFATLRLKYNDRGNAIEAKRFGRNGEPMANAQGIASTKNTYDARGNLLERAFLNVDGKATLISDGSAGFRDKYDDRGNLIEAVYFGLDGAPVQTANGNASFRQKFDDHRKLTEATYFGVDGKPTLTKEGIAKVNYAYDAHGNEIERAFFGIDAKPILVLPGGNAGYHQAFDARGNMVMKAYFGINGEPTKLRDGGYAKITWTYDTRGDLVEESYFGADGQPAHDDGCVTIKYSYDDLGRQTKVTYLDAQGHELRMELVIRSVIPGGTGAQAGLIAGDHILAYNGQVVSSLKQLADLTGAAGFPYRALTIRRGAEILTKEVTAGTLGAYLGLARVDAGQKSEAETAPAADAAASH